MRLWGNVPLSRRVCRLRLLMWRARKTSWPSIHVSLHFTFNWQDWLTQLWTYIKKSCSHQYCKSRAAVLSSIFNSLINSNAREVTVTQNICLHKAAKNVSCNQNSYKWDIYFFFNCYNISAKLFSDKAEKPVGKYGLNDWVRDEKNWNEGKEFSWQIIPFVSH